MRLFQVVGFVLSLIVGNLALASQIEGESLVKMSANHLSISLNSGGAVYASGTGLSLFSSPRVEYFIIDRLAIGIQTSLFSKVMGSEEDSYKDGHLLSVGPAATYYFLNQNKISAYVSAAYLFGDLAGHYVDSSGSLDLGLGVNYNFTSWFGMGPRLGWNAQKISLWGDSTTYSSFEIKLINLFFYL